MMPIYVGISGKQGSGKTTTSQVLSTLLTSSLHTHRFNVVTKKFADPIYKFHDAIRELAFDTYGIPINFNKKDGALLQYLGTEWGRKTIGENVWVDAFFASTNLILSRLPKDKASVVIVDDMRFENELESIRQRKGLVFRLTCPKEVRQERCESWRENDTHPSETALDFLETDPNAIVLDTSALDTFQVVETLFAHIIHETAQRVHGQLRGAEELENGASGNGSK